jgi:hypothetical protein
MKAGVALIIAAVLAILVLATWSTVKPQSCGITPVSNFFDGRPVCIVAER